MAIETEVEYTGERGVDSLNARVRIEQSRNRIVIVNESGVETIRMGEGSIVITDDDGVEVLTIDKFGLLMNDGSNDRLLIGRQDGGF